MVKKAFQILQNMGLKYVLYRTVFELKKRTGILKRRFPIDPVFQRYYTLESWKSGSKPFFFEEKESIVFRIEDSPQLVDEFNKFIDHTYNYFSNLEFNLGTSYDWMSNPDTQYRYDSSKHWLDINDFSKEAGDIKYVWEPSRFSHLYTIIRFDQQSGEDGSQHAFDEIASWIEANTINAGPNFKCSQEISLRVLNWVFALYYYQKSPHLTPSLFDRIQHYIYWQIKHVYDNINFSRIAVRNNHAITETLTLYLIGTLFPKFPQADKWKKNGKKWFEEEIAYQIHEDGTYLQFSMNYHRVVVQLLTWGIKLAELNGDRFEEVVYERAKKSLRFLVNAMDEETGWLPNYGPNDGALFFKLSDAHFRDYRPQLEALCRALQMKWPYKKFSDAAWYGLEEPSTGEMVAIENGSKEFKSGGFYLYRNTTSLSLIRCGSHRTRPTQADNLHLDLWYSGKNLLHDGGSYIYNASDEEIRYFRGTASHNTVMLGDFDQMEKGPRFVWYHWTQCEHAKMEENEEWIVFEGQIKAFQHVGGKLRHCRRVRIHKSSPLWEVEDQILNKPQGLPLRQLWHTRYLEELEFNSLDDRELSVKPAIKIGYYSDLYGSKSICDQVEFSTYEDKITTTIKVKS